MAGRDRVGRRKRPFWRKVKKQREERVIGTGKPVLTCSLTASKDIDKSSRLSSKIFRIDNLFIIHNSSTVCMLSLLLKKTMFIGCLLSKRAQSASHLGLLWQCMLSLWSSLSAVLHMMTCSLFIIKTRLCSMIKW